MIQPRDEPGQLEGRGVSWHWGVLTAAAILVLAIFAAYANTFAVPMLLDDRAAIADNFSAGHRGWWATALAPPDTAGTGGRPLLNFTFALNHAWSGEQVWSFHLVNVVIHAFAALVFFGVIRHTLLLPSLPGRLRTMATEVSFVVAALWALHPLQTESVTYLSQRAESLAGFFYWLTLYGFVRAVASDRPGRWKIVSICACCFGMATKEVMVTAPIAVLLYDRAFVSRSFREALGRRSGYYAGLAAGWLLLGYFMSTSQLRLRGVGFEQGVGWFDYACAETKVVVQYFQLACWPQPLVFDYGPEWIAHHAGVIWPDALLIAGGLAATLLLWRKSRPFGFAAASFFLLLAPTSSVVPIATQPMAESRMYLPLGALVALAVLASCHQFGRRVLPGFAALALLLAVLSFSRNRTYGSAIGIWEDTLAKNPSSSRAHHNLAVELAKTTGGGPAAMAHYGEALRLKPDFAEAHVNLATELARTPARAGEAIAHFEAAIRINPRSANAHYNLALALAPLPGRAADALAHYETALRLRPGYADAHNNLAVLLAQLPGRMPEALAHYAEALRIRPDYAEAHNNFANDLARLPGRGAEALAHYEAALRSQPDFAMAHVNLANELAKIAARQPEALAHYEQALRLEPDNAAAHTGLAKTLMTSGRADAAIAHCEAALRQNPALAGVRASLAVAFAIAGRLPEAVATYREILRTQRNDPEIFYNLGVVHQQLGRVDEAAVDYENALALNARHWGALNNLGVIWADRGQPAKAVKYFEAALASNPGLEGARTRLRQLQENKNP